MSVTTDYGWRQVRIRQSLLQEIDRFITNVTKYGVPKYMSKADFVEKACIMLLEKERSKVKVEVAART